MRLAFVRPEAFLLLLPALALLGRRLLAAGRTAAALRLLALVLLAAAAAEPVLRAGQTGRDLVIALDRSRSAGDEPLAIGAELVSQATTAARRGDRVGVVAFAGGAALEQEPQEGLVYAPPRAPLDREESDLGAAIRLALSRIPLERPGSILLVGDGLETAGDAQAAALEAARRGIRIDAVPVVRRGLVDVYVEDLAPPAEVEQGEPFTIPAFIHADWALDLAYTLARDGEPIQSGTVRLEAGRNRLLLADRIARPGLHRYRLELYGTADRIPENDRASAVVRVDGPPTILCVTPEGREDRLTRSLAQSGLAVEVASPAAARLDLAALDGYRAVVLENVPAGDLPQGALEALARFVEEQGGGLLMTGGKASFGRGGYRRTRLERALPVTLEVRREHRRFDVAMAIALDRSGSMTAPAGGGTKMDLANEGAAAAIELLSATDEVAVLAVDTSPERVVPMQPVGDGSRALADQARRIRAGGGGIYMEEAVLAAAAELERAKPTNRHLVVFADASDAEEPGALDTFLPGLHAAGTTVSIIALGTEKDVHADLLKRIAELGGGRCVFVAEPEDLPRVFVQEAIQAMEASFIEAATPVALQPSAALLGELPSPFPIVDGYSVAYPRPEAHVAALAGDGRDLPILAFWTRGPGRAAALTAEADGAYSGGLASWARYGDFFATLARWLARGDPPVALFARVVREGAEARVVVEAAPGAEALLARVEGEVVGEAGLRAPLALLRAGADRLEGRFRLRGDEVLRPLVRYVTDDGTVEALPLPPVVLPLAPELLPPRDPRQGERLLRRLAALTGGQLYPQAAALLAGSREGRGTWELAPWALLLALLLALAEIALRRLGVASPRELVRALVATLGRRRLARGDAARGELRGADRGAGERAAAPGSGQPARGGGAARPEAPALGSVLERAKQRVQRRIRD